jgi:hypothetical protein
VEVTFANVESPASRRKSGCACGSIPITMS